MSATVAIVLVVKDPPARVEGWLSVPSLILEIYAQTSRRLSGCRADVMRLRSRETMSQSLLMSVAPDLRSADACSGAKAMRSSAAALS